MRVAVLEQRVRELEAAVIPSQASSPSLPSTSFIIPVMGSKSGFFLRVQIFGILSKFAIFKLIKILIYGH